MTTTEQKVMAITLTREFLRDIINPKATPRVPKVIRTRARELMKHYPWGVDEVHIERGLRK